MSGPGSAAGRDKQYAQEDLEALMQRAYSYNSRDKHGKANLQTSLVGTVRIGKYLYDLYLDTGGSAWYSVRVEKESGIVSEFEHIFGMTEKQMKWLQKARQR